MAAQWRVLLTASALAAGFSSESLSEESESESESEDSAFLATPLDLACLVCLVLGLASSSESEESDDSASDSESEESEDSSFFAAAFLPLAAFFLGFSSSDSESEESEDSASESEDSELSDSDSTFFDFFLVAFSATSLATFLDLALGLSAGLVMPAAFTLVRGSEEPFLLDLTEVDLPIVTVRGRVDEGCLRGRNDEREFARRMAVEESRECVGKCEG